MEVLAQLASGIRRCQKCRLHQSRTHAVPGEGAGDAAVVFLGEAPGRTEDHYGRPFQGIAGRFLVSCLDEARLPHSEFFFTNCVKCRPPDNRIPRPDELRTCKALWLQRQLAAINPRIIVLLGEVAVRLMLDERQPLHAIRGALRRQADRYYLPTYHPASAMRFPAKAVGFREDMALLKLFLETSVERPVE